MKSDCIPICSSLLQCRYDAPTEEAIYITWTNWAFHCAIGQPGSPCDINHIRQSRRKRLVVVLDKHGGGIGRRRGRAPNVEKLSIKPIADENLNRSSSTVDNPRIRHWLLRSLFQVDKAWILSPVFTRRQFDNGYFHLCTDGHKAWILSSYRNPLLNHVVLHCVRLVYGVERLMLHNAALLPRWDVLTCQSFPTHNPIDSNDFCP